MPLPRAALPLCALALAACAAAPSPFDRATSLAREHREADAIRLLRDDLARHPDHLRERRLLVRVLALTGDMGAARREVSELERRLGATDPLPWLELGHAYELSHRYDEALEMYDHAAEVAPTDPRGPREAGMRAARWGEAEVARPRLEEAVRRGAKDAETFHALGLVRLHTKDLDGAAEAYRAGLAADPKALECELGLATVAVARGDGAGALAAYDAILAAKPGFSPAHLGRAWALARLGRRDEAARELDEAARLGGDARAIAAQRKALGTR